MTEQSGKHGAHIDDEMRHETQGMQRSGHPTRAEEWKETEPVENDQDRDVTSAGLPEQEGSPPGMSARDVEERSDVARHLAGADYPARPGKLAAFAADQGAPDSMVDALRRMPDREYTRMAEVSDALGYGNETKRV